MLNPVNRNELGSQKAKGPHVCQPGAGWAAQKYDLGELKLPQGVRRPAACLWACPHDLGDRREGSGL